MKLYLRALWNVFGAPVAITAWVTGCVLAGIGLAGVIGLAEPGPTGALFGVTFSLLVGIPVVSLPFLRREIDDLRHEQERDSDER